MKKIVILITLLYWFNIGFAQKDVGLISPFSLEFAIIPVHASNTSIQTYTLLSENFRLTYNSNLLFNYHSNNNWMIQSGIQYKYLRINVRDNFQFKDYTLDTEFVDDEGRPLTPYYFDMNSSFGDFQFLSYVLTDRLEDGDDFEEGDEIKFSVGFRENLTFLGIPFYVNYSFGNKKTRFTLKAGLAYHHLIGKKMNNEEVILHTDGSILINDEIHRRLQVSLPFIEKEFDQIKSGYLESVLGIGLTHQIQDKFFLVFQPMITRGLTPMMDTEDVQTYHNTWALYVGLRYHLR